MAYSTTTRGTVGLGWLIVLGALLIRLYYMNAAVVDSPFRADAGQYVRIALNVIDHATFSMADPRAATVAPDTYRAPGYPALIAFVIKVAGTDEAYDAMLLLQCLLGAATAGLTILLARQFMRGSYACVAGALVAIWPHLVTIGGLLLTETVFGFLVVAAAFFLAKGLSEPRLRWFVMTAAALGFAALVNQVILGFALPLLIWLCVSRRWRAAGIVAVLAIAPPAVWAVRDAHTASPQRMSAASRLFENVLTGMEPNFVPSYKAGGNAPAAVAARERIDIGLSVFGRDHAEGTALVMRRLSAEPLANLGWYLSKPALLWSWAVLQGHGDIYVYPMLASPFDTEPAWRIVASLCHGLNLALFVAAVAGACAVLLVGRRSFAGMVVAVMFLFATVVYSILNADVRYAAPFRPFEMMLAAFTLAAVVERVTQARAARKLRHESS